nr:sigma 54 modulation/S30EA ribosomal C-terminal domain-containing protein [Actinomycetes bacterium]
PADVVYADGPVIVRQKTHETKPMTVEDALDSLELVGHEFYFFVDSENAMPSVVYRRRGYDYGLIRLDVDNSEQISG